MVSAERMRKRVCDDQGDDGPFDVNCYHHALAREG
jgi:hypothetical protein